MGTGLPPRLGRDGGEEGSAILSPVLEIVEAGHPVHAAGRVVQAGQGVTARDVRLVVREFDGERRRCGHQGHLLVWFCHGGGERNETVKPPNSKQPRSDGPLSAFVERLALASCIEGL